MLGLGLSVCIEQCHFHYTGHQWAFHKLSQAPGLAECTAVGFPRKNTAAVPRTLTPQAYTASSERLEQRENRSVSEWQEAGRKAGVQTDSPSPVKHVTLADTSGRSDRVTSHIPGEHDLTLRNSTMTVWERLRAHSCTSRRREMLLFCRDCI